MKVKLLVICFPQSVDGVVEQATVGMFSLFFASKLRVLSCQRPNQDTQLLSIDFTFRF